MPFDLNGLFESITHGISKIPSAVMAAIILGGPTAIWIITRFVHPPEVVKTVELPTEDRLWLCGSCLSINEDRHLQCYRCSRPRVADSLPVVIHGGPAAPRLGVAVGPGLGEGLPAGWLGGEFVPTAVPKEARRRTGKASMNPAKSQPPAPIRPPAPAPTAQPAPEPEPAVVEAEPPAAQVEPQILKPRVKVSTRAAASKPAKRRGRPRQGAGEAN